MYYFAYGSNMNSLQMRERCPGSRFIGKATLDNFKFVYDGTSKEGGAVGNIVKEGDEFVLGGLYEINDSHFRSLDRYEGYRTSYDRKEFSVQTVDGKFFSAIVYLRTGKQVGEPSSQYRSIVIQGARDCGLPEEYIQRYL